MHHKYNVGQKVRVKILCPSVYTIGIIIEVPNQNDSYYTVDLEGCICYADEQYILPYEDSAIMVNVRNLI